MWIPEVKNWRCKDRTNGGSSMSAIAIHITILKTYVRAKQIIVL